MASDGTLPFFFCFSHVVRACFELANLRPYVLLLMFSEGFEGTRRSIRNPRAVAIALSERRRRSLLRLPRETLSFRPPFPNPIMARLENPRLFHPQLPGALGLLIYWYIKFCTVSEACGVRPEQYKAPYPCLSPPHCVLLPPPPSPVFPKQEAVAKAGKPAAPSSKKPEPAVSSAGVAAAAGTTAAAATAGPAVGGAAAAAVAMAKAVVAAATGAAETAPGAKAAATASKPPSVIAPPPSVQAPSSIAVLKPAGSGKSSAPEAPKALVSAAGKGAGAGAGVVAGAVNSYEMSDHDGSSSDSDSDEEESSERRRRMGKKVCLCRVMGWSQQRCLLVRVFFFVVPGSLGPDLRGAGAVVYYIYMCGRLLSASVGCRFACFRFMLGCRR